MPTTLLYITATKLPNPERQPPPETSTDCCQGCSSDNSSCTVRYRKRFRARSRVHKQLTKREITADDHEIVAHDVDPTCNSERLKKIMLLNITKDVAQSKREIQKNSEAEFKSNFNVICSETAFSYVAHTSTYCQASVGGVNCYAFSF
ncbi:unnamed protein product [Enterobius vermicularis]|uniref:Ground-like domain-containing protein n=1 Tax=Enterobius vermicularis TaxID=51028 RepID=A0A0N4USZ2_ENTVE|nr:unnamed protein product [Enterobius vermicularis]